MVFLKFFIAGFIILSVFIQTTSAEGNNIQFESLSLEDGLPHSSCVDIKQDSKGFLWFALGGGLARYDGYQFTHYKPSLTDTNSLPGIKVNQLLHDTTGDEEVFWIATGSGLSKFNPAANEFTNFNLKDPERPRGNSAVRNLCKTGDSILWIGTSDGLVRMNLTNEQLTFFYHKPGDKNSLPSDVILTLHHDTKREWLWIGTQGNFCRLDLKTNKIKRYWENAHKYSFRSFMTDTSGQLWTAYHGGLLKYNEQVDSFMVYPLNENAFPGQLEGGINQIIEFEKNKLMLSTANDGILLFNKQNEQYSRFAKAGGTGLSSNQTRCLYLDKGGVLWVGTFKAGVNKANLLKKPFNLIAREPGKANTLHEPNVYSIYKDRENRLWLGTFGGGLFGIDGGRDNFFYLKHQEDNPHSLTTNNVVDVLIDKNNTMWVAGGNYGLMSLDLNKSPLPANLSGDITNQIKFTRHLPDENDPWSLAGWSYRDLHEDHQGNIWIATRDGGLSRYSHQKGKFTNYLPDSERPHGIMDNAFWVIYQNPRRDTGQLWLGSYNKGLIRMDMEQEKFYQYNQEGAEYLSTGSVNCIQEDKNGYLWLGIGGTGLAKINPANPEKPVEKLYTVQDGLPNIMVYGILEDNHENLWLSTEKGLTKFNPESETFKTFNKTDGLQGDEFNFGAYYKDPETGIFYFGGINGVTYFHPDSIKPNPVTPSPVITGLNIFNKPISLNDTIHGRIILKKNISYLGEIVLTRHENIFTLEFVGLQYAHPAKNKYAYMLDGLDKEWNYVDAGRRFATYTNLPPGKYTFMVKAANNDGVWNPEPATLLITVLPPWWKTWWAFAIYSLFFLFILFIARKLLITRMYYINQLELDKLQIKKHQELEEAKTKFFMNISHEFRTPLTLILGPTENLLKEGSDINKNRKQLLLISRNAKRLLSLVNQLINLRRLESKKIDLNISQSNIISFIVSIYNSFHYLAEKSNFTYQLKIDKDYPNPSGYFDQDILEKIFYNLISNAFKYTPNNGKIIVHVAFEEIEDKSWINVSITDSGYGISPEHLEHIFERFYRVESKNIKTQDGSGIGLALTKELVKLHHGNITVKSQPGKGSMFTFSIPISRNSYHEEEITENKITTGQINYARATNLNRIERQQPETTNKEPETDRALILIVDDNIDLLEFIRLEIANTYNIIEARNGEIGFELAIEKVPDLIISDLMMPIMDGIEMCAKIKTDPRTSHIPVIMLTAKNSEESQVTGFETGADDYTTKPFSMEILKAKINAMLENRNRLHEKFANNRSMILKDTSMNPVDKKFLNMVNAIIEENYQNPGFNTDALINMSNFGRSNFYRKVKALIGKPASGLIMTYRLKTAAELLRLSNKNISEIADTVGFTSHSVFCRAFQENFNQSPTEFRRDSQSG